MLEFGDLLLYSLIYTCWHTLLKTLLFLVYFPLFQLSIHFKLLLTAARFVILPFLFYLFYFYVQCHTHYTKHSHFLSTLSFKLSIHFKLPLTAARFVILPFLFYLFYFYVQCHTHYYTHSHFLSTLALQLSIHF